MWCRLVLLWVLRHGHHVAPALDSVLMLGEERLLRLQLLTEVGDLLHETSHMSCALSTYKLTSELPPEVLPVDEDERKVGDAPQRMLPADDPPSKTDPSSARHLHSHS